MGGLRSNVRRNKKKVRRKDEDIEVNFPEKILVGAAGRPRLPECIDWLLCTLQPSHVLLVSVCCSCTSYWALGASRNSTEEARVSYF